MNRSFYRIELIIVLLYTIVLFSCSKGGVNELPKPEQLEPPIQEITEVLPLCVPVVDNSTVVGKAMFGYQGWFSHPDDINAPHKSLWHWGASALKTPPKATVEMYPDYREYCVDEKYRSAFTYPNGNMAPLYSAGNERTVLRHMKWLRDYHLDGVFLQRFLSEVTKNPQIKAMRDLTTRYIMKGCEEYGRIFAVMYDGTSNDADQLINDWKHLIDDIGITKSSRYLHQDGLPVVTIYGYIVKPELLPETLTKIMDFFTNCPEQKYRASVMLTLGDDWTDAKYSTFHESIKKAKIISNWAVGRYSDISKFEGTYLPQKFIKYKKWCDDNEKIYIPVIFPGFSWVNLKGEGYTPNQIKRLGGTFMWAQAYNYVIRGVQSLYFAMFDEVDEATCFYKTAEDASMSPKEGWWLNLDADGYKLPSDWYLRCASKATLALHDTKYQTKELGTPPLGGMSIVPKDGEGILLKFPDFPDCDDIYISIDNGENWSYNIKDKEGEYFIELPSGEYEVCVRQNDGGTIIPMGKILLGH